MITIERKVHFGQGEHSRKKLREGEEKAAARMPPRSPRVAKLMAVAIRFEGLVKDGVVADYAELASLGHVSRARMSQIMNLLSLAPDIQEAILFLEPVERGKDPITERDLRLIVAIADWKKQRRMWRGLVEKTRLLGNGEMRGTFWKAKQIASGPPLAAAIESQSIPPRL